MLRPLAMLAGAGLAGLLAVKLLPILLFPLLGWVLGLVMWVVKAIIIASLVWWAIHLFKKWGERGSEA